MRRRLTINALASCLVFILQSSQAQAKSICLGGSFGVGHCPMTDWREFGMGTSSNYDDSVGLYGEIYARVALRNRHGLSLSVERISKSASNESIDFRIKWDFVAVPMNLTYEFSLRGPTTGATPFFGMGLGLYHGQVESVSSSTFFPSTRGERDGWGYGIHGYIGQRVAVTQSLAVSAKLRGRWADSMYFTDGRYDIDVDFTGIDATVGMEWLFLGVPSRNPVLQPTAPRGRQR